MQVALVTFGGYGHYPQFLIKGLLRSSDNVTVFAPDEMKEDLGGTPEYGDGKRSVFPETKNAVSVEPLDDPTVGGTDKKHPARRGSFYWLYPWMYFGLRSLSRYPMVLTVHDPEKHSEIPRISSSRIVRFVLTSTWQGWS